MLLESGREEFVERFVVVVGGGPIGVATALDLGQQGIPVLVLDDDPAIRQLLSDYLGDNDIRTESLFRHVDHFVDLVGPHEITTDPPVPSRHYHDSFGNFCTRVVAPAGHFTVATRLLFDWRRPLEEEAQSGTLISFEEESNMEQAVQFRSERAVRGTRGLNRLGYRSGF